MGGLLWGYLHRLRSCSTSSSSCNSGGLISVSWGLDDGWGFVRYDPANFTWFSTPHTFRSGAAFFSFFFLLRGASLRTCSPATTPLSPSVPYLSVPARAASVSTRHTRSLWAMAPLHRWRSRLSLIVKQSVPARAASVSTRHTHSFWAMEPLHRWRSRLSLTTLPLTTSIKAWPC